MSEEIKFDVDNDEKVDRKQKIAFTAKINDKPTNLAVVRPNYKTEQAAQLHYNGKFRQYINNGAVLRIKVDDILKEQGAWNDEKKALAAEINQKLFDGGQKLKNDDISAEEKKSVAEEMQKQRQQIFELINIRSQLDQFTAESQAEESRFKFLVSICTVYNDTGKPFFAGFEDFDERLSHNEPVASYAFMKFNELYNGVDINFYNKLPENEYLAKLKPVESN